MQKDHRFAFLQQAQIGLLLNGRNRIVHVVENQRIVPIDIGGSDQFVGFGLFYPVIGEITQRIHHIVKRYFLETMSACDHQQAVLILGGGGQMNNA